MSVYEVERGGRVRLLDVNRIRRRLARGQLSPDVQVRPVGDPAWRAIRDVPELLLPALPGPEARWNEVKGFLWNAGAWGIMTFLVHLPPIASMFWGLAVALHGVSVVVKLASAARARRASLPEEAKVPGALPAPARAAAADPFLAELEIAIAELEKAAGAAGLPRGVDLAALRTAAAELRRQHLTLEAQSGAPRERLEREHDEALAGAERAKDPRTAEVLRDQATSVERRLAALDQAADVAGRLAARERTLLHQVESLRLSLLQSGVEESRAPDLAEEVERLRLDLRASEEVEADLARARLGARLGQRT